MGDDSPAIPKNILKVAISMRIKESNTRRISGLIGSIVPRTEIAMLSKLLTAIALAGESNSAHEFFKERIRMELVQTLIHCQIRE